MASNPDPLQRNLDIKGGPETGMRQGGINGPAPEKYPAFPIAESTYPGDGSTGASPQKTEFAPFPKTPGKG